MVSLLSPKTIEDKILENFAEYISLFGEFQSEFLLGLNQRYQNLENGKLVIYFAKKTHQSILRKKEYDFNFNLSFDRFWQNHSEIQIEQTTIKTISNDTQLAKETARRKILELIKQKVLNRESKLIKWLPTEQYKKSYNEFVGNEIIHIARLIKYVCNKINIKLSQNNIESEIKNKFSFYWFHYLDAQLRYMSLWKKQLQDLEVLLIALQISTAQANTVRINNLSHNDFYEDSKMTGTFFANKKASVSATSISDITGIPRATCIRKLSAMTESKMIEQDNITKRYSLGAEAFTQYFASKKANHEVVKIYSEFYFICLRALTAKPLN